MWKPFANYLLSHGGPKKKNPLNNEDKFNQKDYFGINLKDYITKNRKKKLERTSHSKPPRRNPFLFNRGPTKPPPRHRKSPNLDEYDLFYFQNIEESLRQFQDYPIQVRRFKSYNNEKPKKRFRPRAQSYERKPFRVRNFEYLTPEKILPPIEDSRRSNFPRMQRFQSNKRTKRKIIPFY